MATLAMHTIRFPASMIHRAGYLLPSKRDTGVRFERSLGNQRAAAVVTSSLDDSRDGERVLLFWLVRRDGAWRINKSDTAERRVVDERLRGFLEAGDVRWHVRLGELLGHWEAGPCSPPGVGGVACGSRLQLSDDNRYRLVAWGPGGPPRGSDGDDVMQEAGGLPTAVSCCHIKIGPTSAESRGWPTICWSSSLWMGRAAPKYERIDAAQGGARKERRCPGKPVEDGDCLQ